MTEGIRKPRGFAVISKELHAEISRKGGYAAHEQGTAHEWNHETAKAAGRKGGAVRAQQVAEAKRAREARGDSQ